MENSIPDGRGRSDDSNLAHSFYADWIHDRIVLLDKNDLDVVYVGIDRNVILGEIVIHDAAVISIDKAFFVQRHAHSPNDATENLAAGGLGVQNSARRHRVHYAGNMNRA